MRRARACASLRGAFCARARGQSARGPDGGAGVTAAAVVIPGNFSADLARGVVPELQLVVDGSEAIAAGPAARAVSGIVADFVSGYLAPARPGSGPEAAAEAGLGPPAVTADIRVLYNPTLESRNFFVPGILALVLMVITMLLTSIAIVKEKERGTLEQLIVSPLRPRQIILGKLLPFAGVGFLDMLLVLGVAVFGFRVVPAGSVALLLALSLLFILTTLGLGLFISTVSTTQQQAMMTAMFFVMMPMMFLSGFVFPIENMPVAVQWLTYLLPLRYYFTIIRGIFLRGVGLEVLWPQALGLLVFGAAVLAISVARFRKRLD
ncbi:MAG: ABC transporter permease [Spirochaetaceae bacterium]|nr:MAG: ABC transporter permease [Spirochaetaceae bacterium]